MAKRLSESERARKERAEAAKKLIEKKHPEYQELLFSWFGIDLTLDVKDKDGEWHRYYHLTDDPSAAAVLGGL